MKKRKDITRKLQMNILREHRPRDLQQTINTCNPGTQKMDNLSLPSGVYPRKLNNGTTSKNINDCNSLYWQTKKEKKMHLGTMKGKSREWKIRSFRALTSLSCLINQTWTFHPVSQEDNIWAEIRRHYGSVPCGWSGEEAARQRGQPGQSP